jgi:hypothetical protein
VEMLMIRQVALCALSIVALTLCLGDTHLLGVMTTTPFEPETNMYTIQEQTEGRGEDKEIVLIKRIGMAPSVDKVTGELGFVRLKSAKGNPLPCLKIILSDGRPDHTFEFIWSNHAENKDESSPGKYKLRRTDNGIPLMLYVKDVINGRKIKDRNGKDVLDFVAMAQQWDSHYDVKNGWTYGENHPLEKSIEEFWDTCNIETANENLQQKFGDIIAADIMCLLMDHELFQKFVLYPAESLAA